MMKTGENRLVFFQKGPKLEALGDEPDLMDEAIAAARQESATALKEHLKTVERPERKELKGAVNTASKVIRSVWSKGIRVKDVFVEKFGDDRLGESTPGNLSDGIMVHPDLLHPFARAKFIETLVHEGHHVHGAIDGEEGEVFVRAMTKQYSNLIQSEGYEEKINALEEIALMFEGGDKMKGMREMVGMYVTEPKTLYETFIRKYCEAHGVSAFALWYHKNDPFEAAGIFAHSKDGRPIPEVANEGHALFAIAFPELAAAHKRSTDGGMHWEQADVDVLGPAANDDIPENRNN